MALKQNCPLGGSVTLSPADTANNYTLTLPAVTDTIATLTTAGFASGTVMMFVQTAAPTGWTKSTTHDNKALRVVSGTASSGGSVAFTTAFASQTPAGSINTSGLSAGATTLSTSQIPSHTHDIYYSTVAGNGRLGRASSDETLTYSTNATGGGSSHTHTVSGSATFTGTAIDLTVQYVDVIIATKN